MVEAECVALARRGVHCPSIANCQEKSPPLPSYFVKVESQGSIPCGCWSAHTALTVQESLSIINLVDSVFTKRGLSADVLTAAAVLHDVGKLSVTYLQGKEHFHNIQSAIVAFSLLNRFEEFKSSAIPVAQAVLLHHEHRMWEHLSKSEDYAIRDYYSILRKYNRVVLDDRRQTALEALLGLVECIIQHGSGPLHTARELIRALLRERIFVAKPADHDQLVNESHLPRSLPIYYVLQLADNRAAWLRSGIDWRAELGKSTMECVEPLELAECILKRYGGRSRLLLTLSR